MVVRQLIALPSQLQLIDRLQHHIYLSSSLIFVSGEQGSGKTTLLEQLANKLPGDVQEAFIPLHGPLSDSQIRQQVIVQLYDEPLFDAQDSLYTSIDLLQEKQHNDVPRLIIFDNAHNLSAELLSELGELIANKGRLGDNEINVLLLADEESSRQMFACANQQCACLEFKLEALSKDEANSLLNHIFRQADYQYQVQHQDALAKQLTACAGVPQKVIALAEEIIAGKLSGGEPSWLKTRLPSMLLMFCLLVVAAGIAHYFYPVFISTSEREFDVEQEGEKAIVITAPVKQDVVPDQGMVEELAGSWQKELVDIEESSLQVGIADTDDKRELISENELLDLAAPEQAEAVEEEKILAENEEPAAQQMQERQEVRQVQEVSHEQETVQSPEELQAALVTVETTNRKAEDKMALLASNSEHALTGKSAKRLQEGDADSRLTAKSQLLSVPAQYYTLQLSAMAAEESLQQFISQYGPAEGELHIYQTTRNNKPWYVVIFGEYDSWKSAERASKTLPDSLAELGSWIKRYQLVHQDLRLNNE